MFLFLCFMVDFAMLQYYCLKITELPHRVPRSSSVQPWSMTSARVRAELVHHWHRSSSSLHHSPPTLPALFKHSLGTATACRTRSTSLRAPSLTPVLASTTTRAILDLKSSSSIFQTSIKTLQFSFFNLKLIFVTGFLLVRTPNKIILFPTFL
jgi:hypothetical protein